jgi:hypothetical protein
MFFGKRLFRITIFILVSLFIFGLVLLIFYELVLPYNSEIYLFWICFAGSIMIALISAYFISSNTIVFCTFLGILFGYGLGIFIYSFLTVTFGYTDIIIYYIIIGISALLFGSLSLCYTDGLCIFYTSLFGAYAFVRVKCI